MEKLNEKIGFIGTGQMATALAGGFLARKLIEPSQLFAFDIFAPSGEKFAKATGAKLLGSSHDVVEQCSVVFLGVKPHQMGELLDDLSRRPGLPKMFPQKLFISIAAGLPISAYAKHLGNSARMARVMPSTPCLVSEGAIGFCLSQSASKDDAKLVRTFFESVGMTFEIPEYQMDALTGLSGSGPAFVYIIIEALSDAGVKLGLNRDTSTKLAAQTLKGAAEMLLRTGEHPGVLKDRITSPGGTTIAGIHALETGGIRAALFDAVTAAAKRSAELSK